MFNEMYNNIFKKMQWEVKILGVCFIEFINDVGSLIEKSKCYVEMDKWQFLK